MKKFKVFVLIFMLLSIGGVHAQSSAQPFIAFLRQLRDVLISSPQDGEVLTYDEGKWKNAPATGGEGGGAPTDATYITQTPSAGLSAEQALSTLATGLLKNTTTTGELGIATAGIDYLVTETDPKISTLTNGKWCTTNGSVITCTVEPVVDTNTTYTASTGMTLIGTAFSSNDGQIVHDSLSGFVANEHIDWTGASAGTIHSTNYVDNNTTYTASGTLLDLTGTAFSINEGTLTNGKFCTFTTADGLVCNSDANNYIHPNHSGDVTSSGDGTTTIANSAVTLAKMANLAQNTIIGRVTASTGVPETLSAANVRSIINVADGANNYTLPTATDSVLGGVKVGSGLAIADGVLSANAASDTAAGIIELATTAETTTGTATNRAVTPDGLSGSIYGRKTVVIKVLAEGTALATGDGKAYFTVPVDLTGMNLVDADIAVYTVSSSGTPTVQIHNLTDTQDMLSTVITVDASEFSSYTATTAPVINTAYDDVATGDRLRIDVDVAGTGTKGLDVILVFATP